MLKKIFYGILAAMLIIGMVLIMVMNANLLYSPIADTKKANGNVVRELRGLRQSIDSHGDVAMQRIFPEGFMFMNTLYALAWTSFLSEPANKAYMDEGLSEIRKAWQKIDTPEAREVFTENLSLPYGAFYNGWSTYVLGSKLLIETEEGRDARELSFFKQQCEKISKVIAERPYPESYHNSAWPADVVVCVATLSLHDRLFQPSYRDVIVHWLAEVKGRLDINGMIPHSVHAESGQVRENARGSSMALMLIFLPAIDDEFAKDQFGIFREKFVDSFLGMTGVREYPKGEGGLGDIDSGPVIFGFGGAATIVGMQTTSIYGADELSFRIRRTVEATAFPFDSGDVRKYFFGVLPMVDAFITWSHCNTDLKEADVSFIPFHCFSLIVLLLMALAVRAIVTRRHAA